MVEYEGMTDAPKEAKKTRSPMTTDRERVVSVRLSSTEDERLSHAAITVGLKLSQYLRVAALEKAKREE